MLGDLKAKLFAERAFEQLSFDIVGVELAATGVGAIPRVLLVGSGIDNLGAGAHTFISGHSQQTTLEMVMTQNGVSARNAATIQAGADFALNLGGTAAMHAPEVYQMGTRLVSSIAEPISQFAQKTTQVISEQIGEMYRQYPGRAGWSFFAESKTKSVTEVNPFKLNVTHGITKSKKEFRILLEDIKVNGLKTPIKYVEHNGELYVVDGHHRLSAAKHLGLEVVPVEKQVLPFRGYNDPDDLMYYEY